MIYCKVLHSLFLQPFRMKISLPILWLTTFLGVSFSLPVKPYYFIGGTSLEQRSVYDESANLLISDIGTDKRDIQALTILFTQLNNTATIQLARGALQVELVRQQVISFVEAFIKEKGLTQILKSAGDSGLATDLVMLVVIHFEIYPGLIDIIKAYKASVKSGAFSGNGSGSSGGLLGSLFPWLNIGGNSSGNSSLLGGSTNSTNSTTGNTGNTGSSGGIFGNIPSFLDPFGIFNGGQTSSSSSPLSATQTTRGASTLAVSAATTSTRSSSTAGTGNIFGGVPILSNLFQNNAPTTSATVATVAATTQLTPTTRATTTSQLQNNLPLTGLGQTISTAAAPTFSVLTPLISTRTTAAPTSGTSSSNNNNNNGSGGLGGIIGGLGNLVGGLFSREELEQFKDIDINEYSKREDVTPDQLFSAIMAKVVLEKKDVNLLNLGSIYQAIISIIGTDSNIEEIFESLLKSGLAVNVVYNALIDDGFYTFVVELLNDLISKKIITLSILWNSLLQSGVVPQVAGIIIGNKAYLNAVFRFIGGILSGQVPIFGLYLAITS